MHAILSKTEASDLLLFCLKNNKTHFSFTNDHGACFAATADIKDGGTLDQRVVYVDGCNPNIDDDFKENARSKFGSAQIDELFDINILENFIVDENAKLLKMAFTRPAISLSYIN